MKDYQERTGRKTIRGTKKLLGVNKVKRVLLYNPMLKWYLSHGLKVTSIHKYLKYKASKPFSWLPEEVSSARRDGDNDPALKQLGDTKKLDGNSFYGKMIEDLNQDLVDQFFRYLYFKDLKEINGAFKIKELKRRVNITRPHQCGIAVYQPSRECWSFTMTSWTNTWIEEILSSSRWTPTRCTWRFQALPLTKSSGWNYERNIIMEEKLSSIYA